MIIKIDTNQIKDAIVFGELLCKHCFGDDFDKPFRYGCYTDIKLKPEFERMSEKEANLFVDKILSSSGWWGSDYHKIKTSDLDLALISRDVNLRKRVKEKYLKNCYVSIKDNIKIAWHGDGHLTIECDGRCVNIDCCKHLGSYLWMWGYG